MTPGSYVNVDKVIEHYKKLNEETEERRLAIERYYQEKDRAGAQSVGRHLARIS